MGDRAKASLLATVAAAFILYSLALLFYRLYLSPLSRFPGPKLAAATKWYEFYYDAVLRGQYTFQIQRLHKQYGPIVRINPFEIHIQDSAYWDELYSNHREFDRYPWILGRFGANTSTSTTIRSDHHAMLRAPLNPLFSKRSVTALEPMLEEKVQLLAESIATSFAGNGRVLVLNDAFSALAGDVVTTYCLGSCFNQLQSRDFEDNFHAAYEGARKFAHVGLHFPSVFLVLAPCPDWLLEMMAPGLFRMKGLKTALKRKVRDVMDGKGKIEDNGHPIILRELLDSNLPTREKATDRLTSEIQQLIGAGVETVAWALTTIFFYVLDKPDTMERLRAELDEAIPDPTAPVKLVSLQRLPYLTAVVKEGLRLSTGVSVRLPRVSPAQPIKYKHWEIPAGIPVSMTTLDVLYDDYRFPDPCSFVPERWLDNPKAKDGNSLSRYLVPFGKGPKMCLGINLAYAELYLSLATLVRRFNFELHETDITDIEIKHDFMVPSPKTDSKGLRVKVEDR